MTNFTTSIHLECSVARSRLKAALINARWLKAWGVLPSCSPLLAISSENMPKWFEKLSTFSKILTARIRYLLSYTPARVRASTSQNVHMLKAPSRPPTPKQLANMGIGDLGVRYHPLTFPCCIYTLNLHSTSLPFRGGVGFGRWSSEIGDRLVR